LLMGHSIATNVFMLGYAWQKGLVPVSLEALDRAIALNGVAIDENLEAFLWGRRAAFDPAGVERLACAAEPALPTHRLSRDVEEIAARRRDYLVSYQDAAYAQRYVDLVERARRAERSVDSDSTAFTEAVARGWFRLLARKDAYEVARLYTDGEFERALRATFDGDYRLRFHLGVPQRGPVDPQTGETAKRRYGAWMMPVLRGLARLKFLRDTRFDPFGRGAERRLERALIAEYEATIGSLLAQLDRDGLAVAAEIARLPEGIRGFGPIRERAAQAARARQAELMATLRTARARPAAVEPG